MPLVASCVIPVHPEFDEPETNTAPYLLVSDPQPLETLSATGMERFIRVTLADDNAGDELFLRWMIDWPPAGQLQRLARQDRLPPSTEGKPERPEDVFQPDCLEHNIASGLKQHKVLLIVSDRPYKSFDPFDDAPSDAKVLKIGWLLNLECPER